MKQLVGPPSERVVVRRAAGRSLTETVADALASLVQEGVVRVAIASDEPSSERVTAVVAALAARGLQVDVAGGERVAVELGWPFGTALLPTVWRDADLRVVVARARVSRQRFFDGALQALAGFGGLVRDDGAARLIEVAPVGLALLDVTRFDDARGVACAPGLVIAGQSPFAVDWVLGELMALDPILNPVLQAHLRRHGAVDLRREGPLGELTPWHNVTLLGAALARWFPRVTLPFGTRAAPKTADLRRAAP